MVAQNENYVQYFTQGDELDFKFDNHKKPTDTGLFTPKSYDDGVSYVTAETAEANLLLAIDAVEQASSSDRIDDLTNAIKQRIGLCKFYLPLKKRKDFWAAVRTAKKPFYFKEEANKILIELDLGENPKKLKRDIYALHIPMDMKRTLWEECDKQIRIDERYESLKKLIK